MKEFREDSLLFKFGEDWKVFKFDEHPFYRNKFAKIQETKAVDFLGIYQNKELYFIEVKDFRGSRIENKKRLESKPLSEKREHQQNQQNQSSKKHNKKKLPVELEAAQKVKDTIACIIGAYRASIDSEEWELHVRLLLKQEKLKVILWLEQDPPQGSCARELRKRVSL